jgi:DNA-binding transcriptional LysR family regulator
MHDVDWADLRVFLAVAEAGQIGRAAKVLALDPTTIGRRLRRLEARLDTTLFERSSQGQTLTEAGTELLTKVEVMADAAGRISVGSNLGNGPNGSLRISVSEGFGSQFLTSYLGEFSTSNPNLTVELIANSGFLSPSKREADIAVMLSRPKAGPVLCRKLSDYSLRLYASKSYLAREGTPRSPSELESSHSLISYVPDLLYAPELNYLQDFHDGLLARIRSSSINAQHQLITEGAGIGVLPDFIGSRTSEIEPVCPEHRILRSFWIVTHKDTQSLARVRVGKAWLDHCVADGRHRLICT